MDMETRTRVMIKCSKCGKQVTGSSEEEALENLKAHDNEMHEGSYELECEKSPMGLR